VIEIMKKQFLSVCFLSFFMCTSSLASSVVMNVLVHGTYPIKKVLAGSYSPFRHMIHAEQGLTLAKKLPKNYHFHKVAQAYHEYDPVHYHINHCYTYGWNSSNVQPSTRYQEGRKLYDAINTQINLYRAAGYEQISVRLIGISHGGNVVLNSLKWLPFVASNVKVDIVLIGTPVQEETRHFINNAYISRAYSFYSTKDFMQKIDIQWLHKDCPENAPFFSQRTFLPSDKVIQVQLTIDGQAFSHGYYRSILQYLPLMLQQAQQSTFDRNIAHIIMNFDKLGS
jgi:hypothetical protein